MSHVFITASSKEKIKLNDVNGKFLADNINTYLIIDRILEDFKKDVRSM